MNLKNKGCILPVIYFLLIYIFVATIMPKYNYISLIAIGLLIVFTFIHSLIFKKENKKIQNEFNDILKKDNYSDALNYLESLKDKKLYDWNIILIDYYFCYCYIKLEEYDKAYKIINNYQKRHLYFHYYLGLTSIILDLYYDNYKRAEEENTKFQKIKEQGYNSQKKCAMNLIKLAKKESYDENCIDKMQLKIIKLIKEKY